MTLRSGPESHRHAPRRAVPPSRRVASIMLALSLVLAGCTQGVTSGQGHRAKPGGAAVVPGGGSAQGVVAYGEAPTPSPDVTYQPDVVVVGGGAGAVHSVSDDSLTWTLDSNAPHARDLRPGKVMFLTSRAVGRVLAVASSGNDIAVTIGPIDLADVIRDGHISVDRPLDISKMAFQSVPGLQGQSEFKPTGTGSTASPAPTGTGSASASPSGAPTSSGPTSAASLAPLAALTPAPLPPPVQGGGTEVTVGPFSAELTRNVTGSTGGQAETSIKLSYTQKGVTLGLTFSAKYNAPRIVSDLSFAGGKAQASHVRISGLEEIGLALTSGSETGLAGNFNTRLEIPAELNIPFAAGPVPMNVSIRFKFIIETAFSAKNATLSATGKLKVSGPIGFDYDSAGALSIITPEVTVAENPIDNLAGVSVGVNAVVIAAQVKVLLGIGAEALEVGPFGALTVSFGLTNGSAIGIVQCKQVSRDITISGGIGFTFAPTQLSWLKNLLGALGNVPLKIDSEFLNKTTPVAHKVDILPKVHICGA